MKIIKTVLPYFIIAILMYLLISKPEADTDTITIPEKTGSFQVDKPQPVVKYDTIFKDSVVEKVVKVENPVNQELLKKYNESQDSLSRLKLYKDAITVRDYKQVFKDDNQEITVLSKVTGTLENQQIDYSIHSTALEYKNPLEGFYMGVGGSFSYQYLKLPSLDVNLSYIKNKRVYSLGVGTDQTIRIGIQQKLF